MFWGECLIVAARDTQLKSFMSSQGGLIDWHHACWCLQRLRHIDAHCYLSTKKTVLSHVTIEYVYLHYNVIFKARLHCDHTPLPHNWHLSFRLLFFTQASLYGLLMCLQFANKETAFVSQIWHFNSNLFWEWEHTDAFVATSCPHTKYCVEYLDLPWGHPYSNIIYAIKKQFDWLNIKNAIYHSVFLWFLIIMLQHISRGTKRTTSLKLLSLATGYNWPVWLCMSGDVHELRDS